MRLQIALLTGSLLFPMFAWAQAQSKPEPETQELNRRVQQLEAEVTELKQIVNELQSRSVRAVTPVALNAVAPSSPVPAPAAAPVAVSASASPVQAENAISAEDRKNLDFLRGTTINLALDTYYEYNFDDPVGRVNLLRAYDVLSNEFSLNQASIVVEHSPDVAAGRRWGGRLD